MHPCMHQSKCRVWFPPKEKINYCLSKQCAERDCSSCGTSPDLLCVWLFNTPLLASCTCATRSSLNLSTYWSVISWKSHLPHHERKKKVSPCNKPMRKRESVIEKIGWEQMWARMGVKAVSEPQAVAASRRTFSPPTLRVHGSLIGA